MLERELPFDEKLLIKLLETADIYDVQIDDKKTFLILLEHYGETLVLASLTSEKVIREVFEDKEVLKKIREKDMRKSLNFLDGGEELAIYIDQLLRCEQLCKDKEFIMQLMANLKEVCEWKDAAIPGVLNIIIQPECQEFFNDKEFVNQVFDFIEAYSGILEH